MDYADTEEYYVYAQSSPRRLDEVFVFESFDEDDIENWHVRDSLGAQRHIKHTYLRPVNKNDLQFLDTRIAFLTSILEKAQAFVEHNACDYFYLSSIGYVVVEDYLSDDIIIVAALFSSEETIVKASELEELNEHRIADLNDRLEATSEQIEFYKSAKEYTEGEHEDRV